MTQDMKKEPILQMGPDKMIPRHVYGKPFAIRFPDRSEWKDGFQPDRKGGLMWYTDGSKTNEGNGAGVYCCGTRRLLIFQPWAVHNGIPGRSVCHKDMRS
jgi:hypothetical protein